MVEVGAVGLAVLVGSAVRYVVLFEVFEDVPWVWAGEVFELEAGSLYADVFEVGPGVWAGVLFEVQPGSGLWF